MNWKYMVIIGMLISIGWSARGWYESSIQLRVEQARKEEQKHAMDRESKIADVVENKLSELKENERTIIREVPKIIVRDVYHNVCLDSDGVQLINNAATGKSSKPVTEVPRGTPAGGGEDRR